MSFTASLFAHPWLWITRLGEAQVLLPLAAAAAAWLGWQGQRRLAWRWMASLAAAILLTTVSKLAFIGWGLGSASWDFTGVSGHAMFAAATLPLLAWTALRGHRLAWALGVFAAALVACSRVEVGAHSVSEAVVGFALGSAATLVAVSGTGLVRLRVPAWLPGGVLAGLLLAPMAAHPLPTHDWVTRLSLQLSGRSHPYTRHDLHRSELPSTQAPAPHLTARL